MAHEKKTKFKLLYKSCYFQENEDEWLMYTKTVRYLGFVRWDRTAEMFYFCPSKETNEPYENLLLDSDYIIDLAKFMKQLERAAA